METTIAIAIDGPAAAGKSTVAKQVAEKLSYLYVDTGAMYRALTFRALEKEIDLDDQEALANILEKTDIELFQNKDKQRVMINGVDKTLDIRSHHVTNKVSHVAKHSNVREILVQRQQFLAKKRNVVMDGRDIGTHVLPNAQIKIFLVATVEERARRRHEENIERGFLSNLEELKKEIEERDMIDSQRDAAPLIKASDAIEIDTTSLTIQNTVNCIINEVNKHQKNATKPTFLDN